MAINRRPSTASTARMDERLHRFLKPGALARLRDTRISARSLRSASLPHLSLPSSPSQTAAVSGGAAQIGGVPCFVTKIYGPQLPQRKKLMAPKSICFLPSSPDYLEAFADAFGVDLVAAH